MAEPTNTRKTLRRAIGKELRMPFFRRYTECTTDTGSTEASIIDATLAQADGYWDNSWLYMLGTDESSIIRSFSNKTHSFIPEPNLAAAPADSGDAFEILTTWNAIEIHDAIDRALEKGGRIFTETIEDKTLIVKEDVLEYALSGLSRSVFILNKVYIENPPTVYRGTASAGGASTITVESVPTGINTNWKISIYKGTGTGQIKNYVSNVGLVITVAAWTTPPDSTSKYAIWDAGTEEYDWTNYAGIYVDSTEFPDYLRLRAQWSPYYGLRMRLSYESLPVALTSDSSTTSVPKEFVVAQACAILHAQRKGNPKADAAYHEAQRADYQAQADLYIARNAPQKQASTLIVEDDVVYRGDSSDPLGWRGNY